MRAAAGLLSSLLLIAVFQAHGSSVLSASKHEHSPEFNGLFDWLRENGAKVPSPHQYGTPYGGAAPDAVKNLVATHAS